LPLGANFGPRDKFCGSNYTPSYPPRSMLRHNFRKFLLILPKN
jgi:hypothetical protein